MSSLSISMAGIQDAVEALNYRPNSPKAKALTAIQSYYTDESAPGDLAAIPTDALIQKIWNVGDNPARLKSKRRNFFSLKSAIVSDLKKLAEQGLNPENITLSETNVFDMTEEAKNALLHSFTDAVKTTDMDVDQASQVLKAITEFLDDWEAQNSEDDSENDLAQQIKTLLDRLKDAGPGQGGDFEEIELEDDEELEILEEDEDEEFEEVDEEELDEDVEEIELDEDEELDILDEDEELEEIDEDDLLELDEDEELEEIDELDDDEEIEEIELDEDEELEEIEDLDEDVEEIELDDDEELEVLDEDEVEEIDEDDLLELDEDEELEEFDEIDDDEEIEEVELDEDEELEEIEDLDEDVEEIELDEDEELEELDELDEDEQQALDDFREQQALAEEFDNSLSEADRKFNSYVKIPAGTYTIGTTRDLKNSLDLQPFDMPEVHMGRYPVTNALFEIFIEATGYVTTAERMNKGVVYHSRFKRDKKGSSWRKSGGSAEVKGACWYQPTGPGSSLHGKRHHPVVQVSVDDAMAYGAWIGRRLPTEAEWESAARTDLGLHFPWGDDFHPHALNIEETAIADTCPVDEFDTHANAFGLADMLGNVMEWTMDTQEAPFPTRIKAPYAVARGGGWNAPSSLTISSRALFKPGFTANTIGFRCISEFF